MANNFIDSNKIINKSNKISSLYLTDRSLAIKEMEDFFILHNSNDLKIDFKNSKKLIDIYINLSEISFYLNDLETTYFYSTLGFNASKLKNNYKIEYFIFYKAIYEDFKGEQLLAEKLYLDSIKKALKSKNKDLMSSIYVNLADFYSFNLNATSALKYYKKAERTSITIADLINVKIGKSTLYYYLSMKEIAIEELLEIESLLDHNKLSKIEQNDFKGIVYQTLSILFSENKTKDLEYKYANKAYELSLITGDTYYQADSLVSLGFYYIHLNEPEKIKFNLEKAEKIVNKGDFDDENIYSNYLILKYKYLLIIKENKKALKVVKELHDLSNNKEIKKKGIYNHFSNVYNEMGDYKNAVNYIKEFNEYDINRKSQARKNLSMFLKELYEESSLENKNKKLIKKKNKLSEEINTMENNKTRLKYSFYIVLFLVFMVCLLLYLIHILYIKKKKITLTDDLTKIPNRKYIINKSKELISKNKNISFILLDIDFFKKVNDTYGHNIGDKVLIELSNLLKKELRNKDYLSRIGGEEFLIVTELDGEQTKKIAERLRTAIENNIFDSKINKLKITVSLGLSNLADFKTIDDLFFEADKNLYKAKSQGRNQVV
jgi:diguanylate cyclase (GGDEF)-like protein